MTDRILCSLAALLLFAGCFKSTSYDTEYVLRPYVQTENQGPFTSLGGVRAYAFAADTSGWTVASYDDALEGVLTSRRAAGERMDDPVAVSAPCPPSADFPNSMDWIAMHTDRSSLLVVAVDPRYRLYAYRQQSFAENLSPYYVSINFRPWRESYAENGWTVINEFYSDPDAPADPAPADPAPGDTPEEGSAGSAPARNTAAYHE